MVNKKCPTDDEDLIEHITSLIDELKEMGATVPDDDSGINNNIKIFVKIKIKRIMCLTLVVLCKKFLFLFTSY